MNSTYNNLIIETKMLLNKKLYEDKIISYEVFELIQQELLESLDK